MFLLNATLKGLYLVAQGLVEDNASIFAIFHIRWVFFYSTSYFLSERDSGAQKIASHILKSLFYQKLVNIVNPDKRQIHTWNTFL